MRKTKKDDLRFGAWFDCRIDSINGRNLKRLRRGGREMGSPVRMVAVLASVLVVLSSCALLPQPFQPPRDVQLLNLSISETIEGDLPYDVVVTFRAESEPKFRRACFRWVTQQVNVKSPSLYCYAYEVQSNNEIGSACARWVAEGQYAHVSPTICPTIENVEYGPPGRFVVRIHSGNIQPHYNRLECYAEYVEDGEVKETNKISTAIRVEE